MPNHESDARLADYQPYWAARAELLARAGECEQAHRAYELAIGLASDPAVRRFLQMRKEQVPRYPRDDS
jgi:RNA polymerase sigma-70 factor (ECF subfamily)